MTSFANIAVGGRLGGRVEWEAKKRRGKLLLGWLAAVGLGRWLRIRGWIGLL
jgi:hypothetical protein